MVTKQILVRYLGGIQTFSHNFSRGMNLIRTHYTHEIGYALGLVHNNRAMPPHGMRKASHIEALVELQCVLYRIVISPDAHHHPVLRAYDEHGANVTREYTYLTRHHSEQDLSDLFDGDSQSCFLRLLNYADTHDLSPRQVLARNTEGMSDTGAFRTYLRSFIEKFEPEYIRDGKKYSLVLTSNGLYDVVCSDDQHLPALLSESEARLFRYLCFLRTAEFWHGFEEIRNLNSIKKPLIIRDFLERLDESIDLSNILKRTANLERQVIFITLPELAKKKGDIWDTFQN